MTHREAQIDLLNWVVNQPEVIEKMAPGYATIDLSKFFDRPENVMLGDDRGVLLFGFIGDSTYEMHYLLTTALHGKKALLACKTALNAMFTKYGATRIVGSTPRDNMPARVINRALGARPIGTKLDNSGRHCIVYCLERDQWAASSAELSAASAA